jgi:hypothetical protein
MLCIVGAIGVAGSLWIHQLPKQMVFTVGGLVMKLMDHLVVASALIVTCSSTDNNVSLFHGDNPLSATMTKVIASFGLANAIAGLFQPVSFAKC